MPTAVDHVEAALARLTREEIAALSPARRERLKGALGAWECLCSELVQPRPRSGVLGDLENGKRAE